MRPISLNVLSNTYGGSCPYCDGESFGRGVRNWFSSLFESMHEGAEMTYNSMQSGK